jgi:HAE1 family hydrophobic/amphiphilic exporter-1
MLVDFAIEERSRGATRFQALVEAGHKRARPIVMTTIAMAAGMFPAALGLGEGGGFRAPMAIAVIGGLVVSTLLSLIFVPAAFSIIDDVGRGLWWVFGRFVGEVDEPLPAAPAMGRGFASVTPLRPGGHAQAAE